MWQVCRAARISFIIMLYYSFVGKGIVMLVDLGTERTAPTGLGLSTRSGRLCLAALQSVQWPVREQCGGEVHSSGAPLLTKGSSNYYKNAQRPWDVLVTFPHRVTSFLIPHH